MKADEAHIKLLDSKGRVEDTEIAVVKHNIAYVADLVVSNRD